MFHILAILLFTMSIEQGVAAPCSICSYCHSERSEESKKFLLPLAFSKFFTILLLDIMLELKKCLA